METILRGECLCGTVRYECTSNIDEKLPCYPESGPSQADAHQALRYNKIWMEGTS